MKNTSRLTAVRQRFSRLGAVGVLGLIVAGLLIGQFRAGLQGVVTDPTKAVVPEATVTLTSAETNIAQSARTNGSGVYSINGLAPGRYNLAVEKAGFTKRVLSNVNIASEQTQSQDVQLELAQQTAQTVTVTAAAAANIDTASGTLGAT